jgi:ech hydrogenase subunit C
MTLYNQTPGPKVVVACGNCATNGVPFFDCYNVDGGIDRVIPVDVYVPGCACRPEAIIDGVVLAISKWKEKVAAQSSEAATEERKEEAPQDTGPSPEVRP